MPIWFVQISVRPLALLLVLMMIVSSKCICEKWRIKIFWRRFSLCYLYFYYFIIFLTILQQMLIALFQRSVSFPFRIIRRGSNFVFNSPTKFSISVKKFSKGKNSIQKLGLNSSFWDCPWRTEICVRILHSRSVGPLKKNVCERHLGYKARRCRP